MEMCKSLFKECATKICSFYGFILAVAICLCSGLWQTANAATFINGMYYVLDTKTQTASLASATGEYGNFGGYAGDVVIPSVVSYQEVEYSVTAIQDRCFYNCKDLTSLTIPASVTKISGTHVFYGCTGIKRVVLEDSNNSITVPGCVYSTQYGNTKATFHYANLESIYVGRSIKMSSSSDSDSPFYGQSSLSEVVIGKCVKELPSGFVYGSAISQVSIPEGVTRIGNYAFAYCPNLSEIIFPNSLEEIGWSCCAGSAIERAFIGDNVKTIEGTFHSCEKLKSVYLGSGIITIGKNAFAWSNMSELYLFSDDLATLDSPGFPKSLSKIFVCNPKRFESLFQDKYLSALISFNSTTTSYTGGAPSLNYQNNAYETTIEYSVPQEYINVGSYTIIIPVTFKYKNWKSQTGIMASYDITAAPLSVIPESVSRPYGTENPTLKCSFFGFKNNETVDVLTRQPNVETTATVNSPVGTYPIIATGAEAQNYSFNYERGTLTITRANQEIEWNQSFDTVNVGDVIELTATSTSGLPVKYTVTDESIAEIYSQGGKKYVEFLKPGSVSIRATQEGNENYNEADRISKSVTVASLVKEVILNQTSVNLNEGNTYQLTTIISPSDAPNKTLEWDSSNTEIATVDSNGKITAIKQGQATIVAKTTDGSNITATCEVKVLKLVSGIVLNVSSASLAEGQTLQLNATITPEQADNKTLQWISSNEAIATVNQSGLVTAVSKGNVVIIAKSTDGSDLSATCDIIVVRPVISITISESEIVMSPGENKLLTAEIIPNDATNKELIWSSSNPRVATVDNGNVVAIANGETIVTVSTNDGTEISAYCKITVRTLVSDIILNETRILLEEGNSVQLTATVLPNDATDTKVIWTSSDESVATVDNGLVIAHKKGSAKIRVEALDGSGVYAECDVEVSFYSGINTISADGIQISTEPFIATIQGVKEGTIIRLFDMSGNILYIGSEPRVEVGQTGFYIIVVDNKSYKIKL